MKSLIKLEKVNSRLDLINKRNVVRSKRSQTTVFIIIAILMVVGILMIFLLRGKQGIEVFRPSAYNPEQYIEKCIEDATSEAIAIMLPQGGHINPGNYKLYKNNKVAYLCYNNNYYYTCINQQPMYIEFLEQEIHDYIEPKIKDCFYSLKQEYQSKKYSVDEGTLNFNVELNPKHIEIDVTKRFEFGRNQEIQKYNKFRVKINSPLYDLAVVAQEIASQEAKFCNFEYLGFSLLYPEFSVEKDQVGSEETTTDIYTIRDKVSGKELLIAIRSCAMPGGL